MSYTRTTWQNSETPLSAANMNNIEDGIEEALAQSASVVSKLYPVGSIHITDQNVNPGDTLGGTWELISKHFANARGTDGITYNVTNTQNGTFAYIRTDQAIQFRLYWENKIEYGDTAIEIATFDIADFGLTGSPYMIYPVGQSDGLNATLLMRVSFDNTGRGVVSLFDTIYKGATPASQIGASCQCNFMLMFADYHMEDGACNQFVWRRTA